MDWARKSWNQKPVESNRLPARPITVIGTRKLVFVEEFISEIEGSDPTRWNQFTDLKRSDVKMLGRVDAFFKKWLKSS